MLVRRLALATGLALATRATMATSLHTYSGKVTTYRMCMYCTRLYYTGHAASCEGLSLRQ